MCQAKPSRHLSHYTALQQMQVNSEAQVNKKPPTNTRTDRTSYSEQVFRQITAIVDATVCHNKPLNGRLLFDTWVVKTRVQHDDGK